MRIGEAAAAASMTAKTLRFYEERGLLPVAVRARNGYREYDDSTIARLDFIHRARTAGLTLTQIRSVLALRDRGTAPCTHVRDLLAEQVDALDAQIAELTALRAAVADLHATAAEADPAACEPGRICSYV